MLLFVLRKMAANKWMVASLLVGVILAVAMVTTIPIYSRGILTRLLLRDLQQYQERTGVYPGMVELSGYLVVDPEVTSPLEAFDELAAAVDTEVRRGVVVPVQTTSSRIQQNFLRLGDVDRPDDELVAASMASIGGLFERVRPVVGEMPSGGPEASLSDSIPVLDAVITRETAVSGRLTYGRTYDLYAQRGDHLLPFRIRVAAVVEAADHSDVYWTFGLHRLTNIFLLRPDDFRRVIATDNPTRNLEISWAYTWDYQSLTSEDAAPMVAFVNHYSRLARRVGLTVRLPVLRILENYTARQRALTMTLWVLQVPLLLMLAFYLFMVSQILIDHERNEIALMKSRGARVGQVFAVYTVLGLFLSIAGVIAGPFLGLLICQILGASAGFLEFVQRRALRLEITPRTYLYAFAASAVALLTILIPALQASRTTIVYHKQRLARGRSRPLWSRLFLDVILLGVAAYGLYRYRVHADIVELAGLDPTEMALDPVLLFMSTMFVIGLGLLFLRVYPLLVRILFRIGARRWSPALFASLIQVGRGSGKDQFLMLFLILSISIGVYNADAARTINQNVEERIYYNAGSDIVIREEWHRLSDAGGIITDDDLFGAPGDGGGGVGSVGGGGEAGRYLEPSFRRFEELPGVAHATPVFYEANASGRKLVGDSFRGAALFGIRPTEFASVAWFRHDLLPSHWYNYLNLLSASPAAALVSRSLAEDAGLELGDPIYITWRDQPSTLYYVYGMVDYWPGYNPFTTRFGTGARHLIVVNLNYLQATTALEPYEVWLRLEPDTETAAFYQSVADSRINPMRFIDARQQIIRERNDPMLQGTNGTLSLGFLVSLGVCFVGFLLYWIFSIRERTLQFGLFRAMGMSKAGIVTMLGLEQLFISGAAVMAGFGIGRLASYLFVPLLQIVRSPEEMVPPLRIISLALDQLRIAGFVTLMLFLGFAILSVFLARIRIHQAVKLGEE